jgi:RPA family protein
MMKRETAWRVFAGEFNSSLHVIPSMENRAPSYVVSPLGAKINRLFAVGVITDVENIGTESEPMWRARLSDPTGVFFLSAGQFQPEAARTLSKLKPPVFAAVIGKSRT